MTNHAVQPARAASTGAGWFATSGYQLGYGVFDGLTAWSAGLARQLREGSAERGFTFLLGVQRRSNSITSVGLPPGIDFDVPHDELKRSGSVIYAGQGELAGRYFRLANMGRLSPADIASFLANLDRVGSGYIPALTVLCRTADVPGTAGIQDNWAPRDQGNHADFSEEP